MYSPTIPQNSPEVNAANMVIQASRVHFKQLVSQYLSHYNRVWNNPYATPDKVIASMGTNAAALFAISADTAALINKHGANVQPGIPTGWQVNFNADGSADAAPVTKAS